MKKSKLIILVIIVIITIIIIINQRATSQNSNFIKIGVILPMTGIASSYGENQLNAIQMAIKEINDDGGVIGKKLQIVLEDDGTDPKREISAFQKLTNADDVQVIIGADWDIMANAVMPLLDARKVPLISPNASPDILQKTAQYFFSTIAPISVHQPTVEKYLRNESGKNVSIIYVNSGWGLAHRDVYERAAIATGKTIVAKLELTKFDNNDLQREISILKSSKPRPDIILSVVNFIDSKSLVEKNKQLGLNARIFGHSNIATTYKNQGIDNNALTDVVVYQLAPPTSKFVNDYREQYGNKEPVSDADKAYDALNLIVQAIKISADSSSAGIYNGLKKISNFQGVAGPIDYTETNWPTIDTAYLEIFNGTHFIPYLTD